MNNKLNYVVSPFGICDDISKCFFHSHVMAYRYGLSDDSKNVASFIDSSNEKINELSLDNKKRYALYVRMLSDRLNIVHKKSYSYEFWSRVFSQCLLRYISEVHQFYELASKNFCTEKHTCRILSKNKFQIVNDFEEQRQLLTSSWLGQEQLLSLYIRFNYPQNYVEFDPDINQKINNLANKSSIIRNEIFKKIYNKYKNKKLFNTVLKKIKDLIYNHKSKPIVGICGSLFSSKNLDILRSKSHGQIDLINIPGLPTKIKNLDIKWRDVLSETNEKMDSFDKFFFFCIPYFLPMYLVENFDASIEVYQCFLDDNEKLEFIVSEAWLSSSSINLIRALAYEKRKVKTIYNEHNCFSHPFVGSPVDLQASVVDEYLTLGWSQNEQKFIKSGSLFPFKIPLREKKYKILYVSYPAEQVRAIYSTNYGQAGWSAICHLKFVKQFYEALPEEILSLINYRQYPKDYFLLGLRYDKENFLYDHLKYVTLVPSDKNIGETCKEQMASSKLVVIDYLSTAYLESLLMDIPTICFWDRESMGLNSDHLDFFENLIEAKIIHISPKSAVLHLLQVYEDPLTWWNNNEVIKLKRDWIKRNIGAPQLLVDHLLNMANLSTK